MVGRLTSRGRPIGRRCAPISCSWSERGSSASGSRAPVRAISRQTELSTALQQVKDRNGNRDGTGDMTEEPATSALDEVDEERGGARRRLRALRRGRRRHRRPARRRARGRHRGRGSPLPAEHRSRGAAHQGRRGAPRQARRGERHGRQERADRGEPAARGVGRQALPGPRAHAARPDPGGQHGADQGGREVRLAPRLQVLHLRHLVDPPVDDPRARRPVAHDPHPRPHGRADEQGGARRAASSPRSWSATQPPPRSACGWRCRPRRSRSC